MERNSYKINQLLMQIIKCRKDERRKSFEWQEMCRHSHNPQNDDTIDLVHLLNAEVREKE